MSAFPTPFERLTDINALLAAVRKLEKSSGWKSSVQRITCNRLSFCTALRKSLIDGTYRPGKGFKFIVSERGCRRFIRALDPADMVLQHALCDAVLLPALAPYLIYDNGASLKGKGMAFTRRRLAAHLREYRRRYGAGGWVLKIDFAKFFDNIPHERLIDSIDAKIRDSRIRDLLSMLLAPYSADVSYTDTDFDTVPYNSLADYETSGLRDGSRILHRSVGIGAPVSQIAGVFYPTPIDNYCKCVRGCKYYGRYMDDIYIIHQDRDFLESVLAGIRREAAALGLFISERKTHITPLRQGFTFCKVKYSMTDTGKVVRRMCRESLTRERRRLRKLFGLAARGIIPKQEFVELYRSWRRGHRGLDCHRSLVSMDAVYRKYRNELFAEET